jgi:hypothetical protein
VKDLHLLSSRHLTWRTLVRIKTSRQDDAPEPSSLPPIADELVQRGERQSLPDESRCRKVRARNVYSITSSAPASSDGGTARPSALAILRLIASSYFVDACTGRSAGSSPLRMPST